MSSVHSRRAFFEKLFTATVVVAATPTVVLGTLVPRLRKDKQGKMLGDYTVDLNNNTYAALRNVGGSLRFPLIKPMTNRIIVTRVEGDTFSAVENYCHHQGNALQAYDATSKTFTCSATSHEGGSMYDAFGKLLRGPSTTDLDTYPTSFNAGTNILTITLPIAAVFQEEVSLVSVQATLRDANTVAVTIKLDRSAHVLLGVFDVHGRQVAQLLNGDREAGTSYVMQDVATLPAGTYFYRIQTSTGYTHSVKLNVLH